MTSAVGSANSAFSYGTLGQVIGNAASVRTRLDTLTEQASTGDVSTNYAGLGAGAATSLTLNASINHLQTYQNNINAVSGQMGVAQTALSQISDIASNFYAQTDNLNGLDPAEVDTIASSAQQALVQVAGLLDSTDGSVYVFGGQDSTNPPVPNPDKILSSGFATQIQTAIAGLTTNGAAATIGTTLGIASSNASGTSPFSQSLSQPASALQSFGTTVNVGQGHSVSTGILASSNAAIVSGGTSTTGSYMRDILRALTTIGSLSSAQSGSSDFAAVVADTRTSLGNALTALNGDAGVMGNNQSELQTVQTQLGDTSTAIQAQLSPVQDVDMTKTLSQLTATQSQLEASYQIIAGLQGLTLTKYLSSS